MALTLAGALAALGASTFAQSFQLDAAAVPAEGTPANDAYSENVDFADVDLDGDWDAAFANGGNFGPDQNRLWTNQGPADPGTFVDETATRFPAILDHSRDVEFVDFDADGDPDLYVSNSSALTPQSNLWWRNVGVGTGVYVDETAARWIDVGVNDGQDKLSSVAPSLALASGGYTDWSCDSDFGDLDNDGDLDLVHSAYGPGNSGTVPTRLFLNDGKGFFREFNPSGVQLGGSWIPDGTPAIWAEGLQQQGTTASDGTFADIALTPQDVDLGDVDNDLDLDILIGARNETPRMFENRMPAGGSLAPFRDVTYAWWTDHAFGANYEQEFGDLDNDGDLDIIGLNWSSFLEEVVVINDGTGFFGPWTVLPESGAATSGSDDEAELIDFDNDGDLDVAVSVFDGGPVYTSNRLYENDGAAGFTHVTSTELPAPTGLPEVGLDIEVADVDGDGDYDFLSATRSVAGVSCGNRLYENVTQVPDTHAPRLYRLEQAPDRTASPDPTVVRVQVHDNTAYYLTWYDAAWLEVAVDGGAVTTYPLRSSGGQVFRGEIPGGLSGQVCYTAYAEDPYGNRGASATLCFVAADPVVNVYCTAKTSSAGCVAAVSTSDPGAQPTSGAADYSVTAAGVQEGKNGLLFAGVAGPAALPFGGGTLCVQPPTKRGPVLSSGGDDPAECDGSFALLVNDGVTIPFGFDAGPGASAWYQWWYRDPDNGPGQLGTALSNAVRLDFE